MPSVTPTLQEIGAINLARTDDGRGDTVGTFTTATRPTAATVTILATLAAQQVASRLGNNIPDEFADRARGAAAFIGAALVEGDARDPRDSLIKGWNDSADLVITQLAKEIADVGAGGDEGPGDDELLPAYGFPQVEALPEIF